MIYINISVIPSQGGLGFLCSCRSSIIIVVIIHIIFLHINNENSIDYPTNTSSIVYLFLNHWLIWGKNSSIGVKVNSLSFEERNEKRHYSTSTLNATEPNYYRTITGDWLTKTIQNCPLNNVQHTTHITYQTKPSGVLLTMWSRDTFSKLFKCIQFTWKKMTQ